MPGRERGILSRPPLDDVITWRTQVDHQIQALLDQGACTDSELGLLELGIQHEMQHQELILTDLLYSFSRNPSHPVFDPDPVAPRPPAPPLSWHEFDGGLIEVGAPAEGFSFDNEHPRHRQFLEPFALAGRLVTNREYQAFMADGGYQIPNGGCQKPGTPCAVRTGNGPCTGRMTTMFSACRASNASMAMPR